MAWIEAKQHRNLAAAAYGTASQELAAIASKLPTLNREERWAAFVGRPLRHKEGELRSGQAVDWAWKRQ
jgi:hypothetical protein